MRTGAGQRGLMISCGHLEEGVGGREDGVEERQSSLAMAELSQQNQFQQETDWFTAPKLPSASADKAADFRGSFPRATDSLVRQGEGDQKRGTPFMLPPLCCWCVHTCGSHFGCHF